MEKGDEGAAAGEPDGRLAGGVAAADDPDPLTAADLGLRRPGRVEDADPLVALEVLDREFAVFGAGGDDHRAGGDLVALLEANRVVPVAGLQLPSPVRGRGAGVELARLGDGAAGQLAAGDPGREAEVVLDPPRGPRLAAQPGALDDQRLQALRGSVDGGAEARRPAADHQQVDLLAGLQLQADPQGPRELAVARRPQLATAGQPHQRHLRRVQPVDQPRRLGALGRVGPGVGEALAFGEVDQLPGRGRVRGRRRSRPRSPVAAAAARAAGRRPRGGCRRAARPRSSSLRSFPRSTAM